jgi:replication factor A1
MYYLACPTCKKKVTDEPGGYRCENCQRSYSEAIPTYNFSFMLSDFTQTISIQCLGEQGEAILGQPAIVTMQSEQSQIN